MTIKELSNRSGGKTYFAPEIMFVELKSNVLMEESPRMEDDW